MYFPLSFVLLALRFLTPAIPLAKSPRGRGISIPIAKRGSAPFRDLSKYATLVQASVAKIERGMVIYQKNTGTPHPLSDGIKISSMRTNGSDPLNDYIEQLWYGPISIGTPLDFDTGSSDLFVPASGCGDTCSGHTKYNSSGSSSSVDLNQTFSLLYGGNSSVDGKEYTDVVEIVGLTAHNQTLGAATRYSTGFKNSSYPPDGLMGMGFQSISAYNAPPVFQTLVDENAVTSPVFAFKFADSGSELYLGGVNNALYRGDFTWIPITTSGYWQASFDNITVNGQTPVGQTTTIFDTGTTQIIGDVAGIQNLFLAIGNAEPSPQTNGVILYTIPCNFSTPIHVSVGGMKVEIPPAVFNLGTVSPGSDRCVAGAAADPGLEADEGFWILGAVFLRNVYSLGMLAIHKLGLLPLLEKSVHPPLGLDGMPLTLCLASLGEVLSM
ncbi:aspartic peptidase domain-containing protein [Russula compacta]|nr:aspartic peptidase domain-containing protein [Russula compacta]